MLLAARTRRPREVTAFWWAVKWVNKAGWRLQSGRLVYFITCDTEHARIVNTLFLATSECFLPRQAVFFRLLDVLSLWKLLSQSPLCHIFSPLWQTENEIACLWSDGKKTTTRLRGLKVQVSLLSSNMRMNRWQSVEIWKGHVLYYFMFLIHGFRIPFPPQTF